MHIQQTIKFIAPVINFKFVINVKSLIKSKDIIGAIKVTKMKDSELANTARYNAYYRMRIDGRFFSTIIYVL